ncbi:MAG: hypothetical protein R3257_05800, partial [bacterium]|nr:hypothetical protein [bacterium]
MLRNWILFLCLAVTFIPFPAAAKKQDKPGLKKVIAVGYVDTGYLGFQNMEPAELSEMFRIQIQKALEKRGYAPVLAKMGQAAAPSPVTGATEIPPM